METEEADAEASTPGVMSALGLPRNSEGALKAKVNEQRAFLESAQPARLVSTAAVSEMQTDTRPNTPGSAEDGASRAPAAPNQQQGSNPAGAAQGPRTPAQVSASALTSALACLRHAQTEGAGPSSSDPPGGAQPCASDRLGEAARSNTCNITSDTPTEPLEGEESQCQNEATSPCGVPSGVPAGEAQQECQGKDKEKPACKGFDKNAKKYRGVRSASLPSIVSVLHAWSWCVLLAMDKCHSSCEYSLWCPAGLIIPQRFPVYSTNMRGGQAMLSSEGWGAFSCAQATPVGQMGGRDKGS